MHNGRKTWANLLGADVDLIDAPWEGNAVVLDGPPRPSSICYGPLMAAAPFIGYAMSAVSAGMTILGAVTQSNGMQGQADAQQRAGQVAVQNAQERNRALEAQAVQKESEAAQNRAAANDEAAKGQRAAIEQVRKGRLLAGRAQAVMAASGAGVDPSMTAGLLAEGDYGKDVALFEGDQRSRSFKNAANVNDYEAAGARYSGKGGLLQATSTQAAYNSAGASTRSAASGVLIGGLAKAGIGLAAKYGGDWKDEGEVTFKPGPAYVDNDPRWATLPQLS